VTFKSSLDFGYNTELARAIHVRGGSQTNSYRPPTPSYSYGPIAMATNLPVSYRTHPTSDYQYEPKSACSLPSFTTDYAEDGLDYTLSGPPYPLYTQEAVGGLSNYSSYGSSRVWYPATPSARGPINGIYYGSNVAAYGLSQTPFSNQTYGLRSSVTNELNNFSFSDMTSSLPTPDPATSHARVLPMPPSRNNPVIAPLHRLANELSYNGNAMNSAVGHSLTAGQLLTAGQPAPLNYLQHQGNPDSVDSYSLAVSLSQPQPDLYSTSDNWTLAPLANDPALRSQNPSSDIYYGGCNDATRKASQSDQSGANSTLTTTHNSSSDLFSYETGDHSRKASQSGEGSQSSLNRTLTGGHNALSEVYYSHCNETPRKASQSGQGGATLMTDHSYQVPYGQEKSIMTRSSSVTSMDIARAARHRPSTGNLQAA
jgi:hypothetical protein